MKNGPFQKCEKLCIKGLNHHVWLLIRTASKVRGYLYSLPLALSLVKEFQSGCEEREDCSSLMGFPWKNGCGPLLIMILKEPCQLFLIINISFQVISNGSGFPGS